MVAPGAEAVVTVTVTTATVVVTVEMAEVAEPEGLTVTMAVAAAVEDVSEAVDLVIVDEVDRLKTNKQKNKSRMM